MLRYIISLLLISTTLTAMHQLKIDLNSDDIDAKIELDVGQFNHNVDPESLIVGSRYLYSSTKHSDFDDDVYLLDVHFLVQQQIGSSREFSFGLGAKLLHTIVNEDDFFALPLGMESSYRLPLSSSIPIRISALLYYSPSVISFGDAKNYVEMEARVHIDIIERAGIGAGYRKIETNFTTQDAIFTQTWFVGMSFKF